MSHPGPPPVPPDVHSWRTRRFTVLVVLIAGIAACSGQSCSCIQPIDGGFPLAQRRENGVQTRLTSGFLQYVSDNAAAILPGLLPTGSTFNVPPVCSGSNKICCAVPAPLCRLNIDPRGLVMTPAPPDQLHFDARIIVKTIDNITVDTSLGKCVLSIDTTRAGAITMRAQGDVRLPVNADTRLTGLGLNNPVIDDIDTADLNLDEPGSDAICAVADLSLIKSFIIDYFKDQVTGLLEGVVEGQLCQRCAKKSDCSQVATACTGGKCIGPDGMSCVQLLGVEGRAEVSSFLASYSPDTAAHIDVLEAAGGYVIADTGLSLGVVGGSQADPHNSCVPLVTAPTVVEVAPSASFQGNLVPGTTTPYHVGIGVHLSHLTSLGYSFWDAGGLCLGIGTSDVAKLSAKTLKIIMPSLEDLIRTEDAPMALQLRPQTPPSFKLGKGTFKMDGMNRVIDDPLLTVTMADLAGDFYLFVDDRYVRVARLSADLALPLGLDTDANGAIVVIAGDVAKAFTNLRVTNSELLGETVAELEAAFPAIFTAALGPLLANIPPFPLPTLAGLRIRPKVITSTDPDPMGHGQFLGIFSDVQSAIAVQRATETTARLVSVFTPPTEVFAIKGRDGREPSITLEVSGKLDERPSEWSWSIDGGPWHVFQTASQLTISDANLWFQGRHTVQVRARAEGDPQTIDPTPIEIPFFIDSEPPRGDFTVENGQILVHASDLISPSETLVYRVEGGALQRSPSFPATSAPEQARVEVRDEAGNFALVTRRAALPHTSLGCDVSNGQRPDAAPLGLLLVVLTLGWRQRRAHWALFLLLPLAAGCSHQPGDADKLAPSDAIGRNHDVRMHEGALHLSAYDQTTGDLAYGKVEAGHQSDPVDWLLVDGWDPGSPEDSMKPYRHGRTAPGPDVGQYSTLALTQRGEPRIAYYDATSHLVKYARGPFPFAAHAIEKGSNDGSIEVGQYPAIVLDLYDRPFVAYMVVGLGTPEDGFRSEVHVASASNDSPESYMSWDIAVVDQTAISCGGRCDTGSACVMKTMVSGTPNTNPAQSSCLTVDLGPCTPGCASDQACVQGTCKDIVPPNSIGGLPEGTGLFAKLVRGPNSEIALVYYDRSKGRLRVALRGSDGKFLPTTIDGGVAGADFGQHVTAAYGADGTLHLAYADAIRGRLLYRSVSTGGTPSPMVVVDNGVRDDGPHPVGGSASLLVRDTVPSVLYQDQATSDLELASGLGAWSHAPLRTGALGLGFSSHQVSDDATRYYTSWVFDRSASPLGRLLIDLIP